MTSKGRGALKVNFYHNSNGSFVMEIKRIIKDFYILF